LGDDSDQKLKIENIRYFFPEWLIVTFGTMSDFQLIQGEFYIAHRYRNSCEMNLYWE
jgi:hypothetical protein